MFVTFSPHPSVSLELKICRVFLFSLGTLHLLAGLGLEVGVLWSELDGPSGSHQRGCAGSGSSALTDPSARLRAAGGMN